MGHSERSCVGGNSAALSTTSTASTTVAVPAALASATGATPTASTTTAEPASLAATASSPTTVAVPTALASARRPRIPAESLGESLARERARGARVSSRHA